MVEKSEAVARPGKTEPDRPGRKAGEERGKVKKAARPETPEDRKRSKD